MVRCSRQRRFSWTKAWRATLNFRSRATCWASFCESEEIDCMRVQMFSSSTPSTLVIYSQVMERHHQLSSLFSSHGEHPSILLFSSRCSSPDWRLSPLPLSRLSESDAFLYTTSDSPSCEEALVEAQSSLLSFEIFDLVRLTIIINILSRI